MTKSHIYFLLFEENSKCVKKHIPILPLICRRCHTLKCHHSWWQV